MYVCGLKGSASLWWYKLAYEEVRASVYISVSVIANVNASVTVHVSASVNLDGGSL